MRLPKDRWPPEWHGKYVDPVVRLVLALYGHPDAGGFWEQHCERALKSVGYIQVPEWIVLAFRCTVRFLPEAALL